ncbi:MAG: zf-HC2 domain-containing protein [Chloroflexi bacterium]|nr:zf-HC2 domain-containing protein [Chloroflexota bacterium]
MHCHRAREYMSLYLDHLLDPPQAEVLHAHLAECPQCGQMWLALQRVSVFLESTPKATPAAGFTTHVMHRLLRYEIRRKRFQGLIRAGLAWAVLWTIVLFASGVIFVLLGRPGPVSPLPLVRLISHLGDQAATVFEVLEVLSRAVLLLITGLWSEKVALLLGIYSLIAFGLVALWARLVTGYQSKIRTDEAIG